MPEDPREIIKAVVETLYSQSHVLGAMSKGISSLISLCLSNLQRCSHEECECSATWKKNSAEQFACDRHLSKDIVNKISAQEDWTEVPSADDIRILSDFAEIKRSTMVSIH